MVSGRIRKGKMVESGGDGDDDGDVKESGTAIAL
jgi:hypothetical protein